MAGLEPGQVEVLEGGGYRRRCAVCGLLETIKGSLRIGFAPPLFGLCGDHGGTYLPVDTGAPLYASRTDRRVWQ